LLYIKFVPAKKGAALKTQDRIEKKGTTNKPAFSAGLFVVEGQNGNLEYEKNLLL
jgi:hypothetical protein